MTTTYSVQMTDSETAAAWMGAAYVTSVRPGTQDSGRVRMIVETTDAAALEAALEADNDVLSYDEIAPTSYHPAQIVDGSGRPGIAGTLNQTGRTDREASWSAWQPDAAYPFGGVSEELAGGLAAYSARIDALGGYGARVRATMPNGVVREGELSESGYGGCQPSLRDADGREWRIPSIMTAERV